MPKTATDHPYPAVRVSRRAVERLASGHPWVYASDVEDRGEAQPGDVVRIAGYKDRTLGIAHHSSSSQIALRVLSRTDAAIDGAFYRDRIRRAVEFRRRLDPGMETCRLVHAEGDLLPGLVVDRYSGCLSAQFLTQGMDRARDLIVPALLDATGAAALLARNDAPARKLEQLPQRQEVLAGEIPESVAFRLNHLQWRADLRHGQKTGIFLDQRENYVAAARHARRRALDCFTSSGGFALHMAPHCEAVEAVDSSAAVLVDATAIRDLNGISNVSYREANVFDFLAGCIHAKRQFDTIVLDPPAFAKTKANLDSALRGYREINYKALRLLAPGGVLITCSCSHHVGEADLLGVVAQASLDANRTLRVLERRTQAADHPILLTVPETLYLKCLILEAI